MGKILSKVPCNEDLFAGNAHQKLANAVAETIKSDDNCTIIGIDGGWGSGKSNLVGIIETCLKNDSKPELQDKYHFFTYDAWGHQNDLPRRSILEELTSALTHKENILNDPIWNDKLENLLAKKKSTRTKIVPSLNFAYLVIALMIALVPVINAIANNIPDDFCRMLFTILIYLIAIFLIVYNQIKNMKKNNQIITCESFFTELFLLYNNKIKEDEKFETISEKEPSSKQFKDWMDDIDIDLQKKQKKLIIVFDNMDRLPKTKVQELWSAIHSFFSEKRYNNIKVIVPFDRLHIRNAFKSEDINDTAVYGDDFINKTFNIVYHVSPPILSSWKQYFESQWKKAFDEDSKLDNAVLQIYDLQTKEQTPRKIVAFINEFVTIKTTADSTIPDKYIALFIFGRSKISEDPMKEILNPSYLNALDFMYKDDKEMPSYISSLYYQLPVNEAMDVVYTRQFTRELDENALESIKTMKESGIAKFNAIMEHAIADVTNTNNATTVLESLYGDENTAESQNFWECLFLKDKNTRGEIKSFKQYQMILLKHINDKRSYLKDLIRGYHKAFTEETDIESYISGINQLATVDGIELYSILERIKKEITPKQFVLLVEKQGKEYTKYGLTCKNESLSDYLSTLDISALNDLSILTSLDNGKYPLLSFKDKIKEMLRDSHLSPSNAEILFNRLKEIRENELIKYQDFFDNNVLESLYKNTTSDFKYDLIAMRLSAFHNYSSSYNYFGDSLNNPDKDTIEKVAKIANNYFHFGKALVALKYFNNPLMCNICKELTLNKNSNEQTIDIKEVSENFADIIKNSDITESELIIKMNDWKNDKESIKKEDVKELSIIIFETCTKIDCDLSKFLLDLALAYMKSISQEDWRIKLLEPNSFELNLIKTYHPIPLQNFFDAFKTIMKDFACGQSNDHLNTDIVETIICISEEMHHDINNLFREIRDIFYSTISINKTKLKHLGKWLFKYADMSKKKGCLEKILLTDLLDDDEIIKLMVNNTDTVKNMIDNSDNSSEFISKLKAMVTGNRSKNKELSDLCKKLNIDIESV